MDSSNKNEGHATAKGKLSAIVQPQKEEALLLYSYYNQAMGGVVQSVYHRIFKTSIIFYFRQQINTCRCSGM